MSVRFYHLKTLYKATVIKVSINSWVWNLTRVALFLGALWVIYYFVSETNSQSFEHVFDNIDTLTFSGLIGLVFVFQFLNWGLEALKLKLLLAREKKLDYKESLKAIYAGNALSIITPDRVGTFIGRFIYLDEYPKSVIIGASFLGGLSQLIVTVLLGVCSFGVLIGGDKLPFSSEVSILTLIGFGALLVMLLLGYFNAGIFTKVGAKIPWFNRYSNRIAFLAHYNKRELIVVLLLSLSRYAIFLIQWILLFKAIGIELPAIQVISFVGLIYLFTTFIPSPFMGNLGTREAIAMLLFSVYHIESAVLFISLLLWFINVALPAVGGSLILLKLKR